MAGWKIVELTELAIAELLVEAGRLEAEGVDIGILHAALSGFLFGRLDDLRPEPFASELVRDPEQRNVHPAQIGLAVESTDDGAPFTERDRQGLEIESADRLRVERPQALEDLPSYRAVNRLELDRGHRTPL